MHTATYSHVDQDEDEDDDDDDDDDDSGYRYSLAFLWGIHHPVVKTYVWESCNNSLT